MSEKIQFFSFLSFQLKTVLCSTQIHWLRRHLHN